MIGLMVAGYGALPAVLKEAAGMIVGSEAQEVAVFSVDRSADLEAQRTGFRAQLNAANRGRGVLLMVDSLGETAANLAISVTEGTDTVILSGINLPGLVAAIEHRNAFTSAGSLAQRIVHESRLALSLVD